MKQESNQAHKQFPIAMASARTFAYISIIILKQSYKIQNNNATATAAAAAAVTIEMRADI